MSEEIREAMCETKVSNNHEQEIVLGNHLTILRTRIQATDRILLVCGKNLITKVIDKLSDISNQITVFSQFCPNPDYEDIAKGCTVFIENRCNKLISIGGGSSMDAAKAIKLLAASGEKNFLAGNFADSSIVHIAIPTTAGTCAEYTQISVLYVDKNKFSADCSYALPDIAILDPVFLKDLPAYHRNSSLADAMCQAIESYWAVSATKQSREYATKCIQLILKYCDAYLDSEATDQVAAGQILLAANYSGRAIQISRTTAVHAMSYKLTQMYGISHGHAVAREMIPVFRHLLANGNDEVQRILGNLSKVFLVETGEQAIEQVNALLCKMNLPQVMIQEEDIHVLAQSVNQERLRNHPVIITTQELAEMYKQK